MPNKDEIEVLTKFQTQLQEMINHFQKGKLKSKFIADDLDKVRVKISRKVGSIEGWYVGETDF